VSLIHHPAPRDTWSVRSASQLSRVNFWISGRSRLAATYSTSLHPYVDPSRASKNDDTMPPRLNIPPITRILLIALVVQSLLSFAIRYRQWSGDSDIVVPYLVLVPQLSLIYPWTFLTTTLVENNVFTLGISGVTIYYGGRYLERAWTSAEFGKFLLVAALIPNLACFGALVILFAVSGDMSWT
jgi:membrane associated rhomboid family serine protease